MFGSQLSMQKIVVTDSHGAEHVFNEVPGEIENYLELNPEDDWGNKVTGVKIMTRTFSGLGPADTEAISVFWNPRKVEVLYGAGQ